MLLRWGFRRCEEVVWVRTKPSVRTKGTKGTKRGDGSGRVGDGGGRGSGDKGRGRASFRRRREGTTLPKDESEHDTGEEETEEPEEDPIPTNLLVTQKEHCLVGIRGTVRRKTDGWFVHCNVGE